MKRVLVVYFSRTGHTRTLAEAIARVEGWDIEPISEERGRLGLLGYLRSGYEAWFERSPPIRPLLHDPRDYDLVVVATPVWNFSVSSPVRAFLTRHRALLPELAFLATYGGNGAERAFAQMMAIAGKPPIATLALTERDLDDEDLATRIVQFVDTIGRAMPPAPSPEAPPPAVTMH